MSIRITDLYFSFLIPDRRLNKRDIFQPVFLTHLRQAAKRSGMGFNRYHTTGRAYILRKNQRLPSSTSTDIDDRVPLARAILVKKEIKSMPLNLVGGPE